MPVSQKSVDHEAEREQRLSLTAFVDQPEPEKPRHIDKLHRSDIDGQALAQWDEWYVHNGEWFRLDTLPERLRS